jgi:hypothetical protein
MDSAEPVAVNPRKASPLTTGEKNGAGASSAAGDECIDMNKANARTGVPAKNRRSREFECTMGTPFV